MTSGGRRFSLPDSSSARLPALGPRLRAAADFVRPGARLCDVGTDHGYLICTLQIEGKISGGLACDIRPGPLSGAGRLVAALGLKENIQLRLCDGLSGVSPDEAEDIVIAGMGGEMIASILSRAPWLREPGYRLILQPQTRAPALRQALFSQGFSILRERGVREGRFLYTVLCCEYTGGAGPGDALSCHVGALPQDGRPESREYLSRLAGQLQKRAEGLFLSAAGDKQEGARLLALAGQILALIEGPQDASGGKEEEEVL